MTRLPFTDDTQVEKLIHQAGYPEGTPATTVFRLLAHAPAVAAPALGLAAAILTKTELDPGLREIVILRVTQRCQAEYAWIQHAAIAASAGVSTTQIAALERGEIPAGLFSGRENAALAFVDGVMAGPHVADDLFARVQGQFSPREVVELLLTVGYFRMIGNLMTTLDIEPDPAWAVHLLEGAREAVEVSR